MKTYNIEEACQEIADIIGLPNKLHHNTLLRYRRELENELSPSASTSKLGPVILIQKDVEIIAKKYEHGIEATKRRKEKSSSPKPVSANSVLNIMEAQQNQNTSKIDLLESELDNIQVQEISSLHGILADQQEEIEILKNQVNVLMAYYKVQEIEIQRLNQTGMHFEIASISTKLDKILSNFKPINKHSKYTGV